MCAQFQEVHRPHPYPTPPTPEVHTWTPGLKKKEVLFHKGQKQTLNFLYLGIKRFLKSSEDTQEKKEHLN